jgi:hypothetical protein
LGAIFEENSSTIYNRKKCKWFTSHFDVGYKYGSFSKLLTEQSHTEGLTNL